MSSNCPDDIELHRPFIDEVTITCPKCGAVLDKAYAGKAAKSAKKEETKKRVRKRAKKEETETSSGDKAE